MGASGVAVVDDLIAVFGAGGIELGVTAWRI